MEEAPLISEWDAISTQPNVVVVPFFIADGLHSYQDIPVLLGIEQAPTAAASQRDIFKVNPRKLRGRTLYYASAIGTEPLFADVILDQVAAFDLHHSPCPPSDATPDADARPVAGGGRRGGGGNSYSGRGRRIRALSSG